MNRIVPIVLLILGVVLLAWGIKTLDSVQSGMSEFFTGSPDAKAIWLLVIGAILLVVGAVGTLRRSRD